MGGGDGLISTRYFADMEKLILFCLIFVREYFIKILSHLGRRILKWLFPMLSMDC